MALYTNKYGQLTETPEETPQEKLIDAQTRMTNVKTDLLNHGGGGMAKGGPVPYEADLNEEKLKELRRKNFIEDAKLSQPLPADPPEHINDQRNDIAVPTRKGGYYAKGGTVQKASYAKGGAVFNTGPSRFAKGR
jgi:hypothetical protein